MKISVAICTWNRASLLRCVLDSMSALEPPEAATWELLVVNNNCTDDTDQVIRSFDGRLPIRRVAEPKAGLSNARNAAIAAASGQYILWTDDDVRVSPQWLRSYATAIAAHPDAIVFGGPIRPAYEGEPPGWLKETWSSVADAYAMRDLGSEAIPLEYPARLPYGANYAVRLQDQRMHPYDPALGRRPGTILVGGEEIAVIRALLEEGTGWWIPDAPVDHWVPRERQGIDYIRRYYEGQGYNAALVHPPVGGRLIGGGPFWMWRNSLASEARYRVSRLAGPATQWMPELINAAKEWGRLAAVRERMSTARPPADINR